ncbi:Luciferin 4-monooxygenase [Papilio machaon]|uniref:Luciferin 4-monooxygenase n=1 Tax=Papilio machaon TaxID=76193 RepID=A0A194R0D8_PAPMA|nr:Luciferin 4-monooxygenase [Papilio machaon]
MLKQPNYLFGPDDNMMPVKINLGDFLVKGFKKHGNKVAMINALTEEQITYNELVQAATNLAVSLVRLGVKKGDVVAICSESRLEIWSTVLGLTCTGAVITPISTGYVKDELKHVMNISRPNYLFCSKLTYQMHEAVFKSFDCIKEIISFDEERPKGALYYGDLAIVSDGSMIRENVKIEEFLAVDVDGVTDTAFIMYSSGTTGLPKGVMLSHLNVIATCTVPDVCDPKLNVLQITPWYHNMGVMVMLLYMYAGSEIVFLPKFELDLYLRLIEKYKIKKLLLVPSVIWAICKTSFTYDVSSVEVIVCGAAVLQQDTIEAVKSKFKNLIDVYQGYGMTEATLLISLASYVSRQKCKTGSVGKITYNTTVKIVDVETRKPLGPYETGEICFKSPSVMKGYIGKDKTEDFDDEGFLKTGDIGYYDDEKYLFIMDRLKELIKYKGYQVPPAEIETLLLQHPGVRDVGVVGLPEAVAGEVPLAFVVPQPGVCLLEAELQKFVADRVRALHF